MDSSYLKVFYHILHVQFMVDVTTYKDFDRC